MRITCEGLGGKYDKRNLSISGTGRHKYPSKKMFVEFLKQYKDIRGTATIWSNADLTKNEVTITVEVKYKPATIKKRKKKT